MSFFFYDLETSGFNPRLARIVQFAGQRTDMELRPIGDPVNIFIKLTPDVLPDPEAVLVTGITPQITLAEGITEAEFLTTFYNTVVADDTIFLGFNSVRFDDEFMRFINYRNFYDAYKWQWQNGCSRWDLLDVVRMTRALRPGGINWPFDSSGRPANRLGLLAEVNKLNHSNAHDALSDVNATIALAQLIRQKQPKLFDFLLSVRDKQKVAELVMDNQPFVYSSGTYPGEFEKTTVAAVVVQPSERQTAIVFDLRFDPGDFSNLSVAELAKRWQEKSSDSTAPLPVKLLQFNRCPAVAPLSVLDDPSRKRLQLDKVVVGNHFKKLKSLKGFSEKLIEALELRDKQRQTEWTSDDQSVDGQLYDGFLDSHDSNLLAAIRAANPDELADFMDQIHDPRLQALLPLYKARNYPSRLTAEEREVWEAFCQTRLLSGQTSSRLAKYMQRIQELAAANNDHSQTYILEELRLYGESIIPVEL
jgi:exodeoxyribonuclease-1